MLSPKVDFCCLSVIHQPGNGKIKEDPWTLSTDPFACAQKAYQCETATRIVEIAIAKALANLQGMFSLRWRPFSVARQAGQIRDRQLLGDRANGS